MMKNFILTADQAEKKLQRMAYEIAERNVGESKIVLAGIKENGVVIARQLKDLLKDILKAEIEIFEVSLDKRNPGEIRLSAQKKLDDCVIILVDDVANSGKTMLYSLKPFLDFHPKKIQTLALVDRTHKTFPVHTDYVGYSLATTLQEQIFVEVSKDKVTGAWLE
ncbi:MAG: phosphoribosyltransferase [Bacteroidetes bacterium]|nr:MAG: phosphoribosyltransferase [Bacteroidota bacterium]